jgi:hypothetical protein
MSVGYESRYWVHHVGLDQGLMSLLKAKGLQAGGHEGSVLIDRVARLTRHDVIDKSSLALPSPFLISAAVPSTLHPLFITVIRSSSRE